MAELTGHMLHFAYGEDLSPVVFKRHCPGADWFGAARLEGYRLVVGAGGRFNVVPDEAATTWGGLWLVPASALAAVDAVAAQNYERTTRKVVSPAGPRIEATLYLSADLAETCATSAQVTGIIEAAKGCRLPAAYIRELGAMKGPLKSGKDSR
ncbi:MAG: gamma-glutamylcyclotransferase family protein [Rariglobus sp.]